jgi:hypothetical protein
MALRSIIDVERSFGYNFNVFRQEIHIAQYISVDLTSDLVKYFKYLVC